MVIQRAEQRRGLISYKPGGCFLKMLLASRRREWMIHALDVTFLAFSSAANQQVAAGAGGAAMPGGKQIEKLKAIIIDGDLRDTANIKPSEDLKVCPINSIVLPVSSAHTHSRQTRVF